MRIPRWAKYLYTSFPMRKPLLLAWRTVHPPAYEISQRLNFGGVFRVGTTGRSFLLQNYDDLDHVIENQIFWYGLTGRWEKKSLELWQRLSTNAKTILDVGANTGIYALAAQAVNPAADVYAFEPIQRINAELEHNIRLNGYPIRSFQIALSNLDGIQTMYERPDVHDYTASLNRDFLESNFGGIEHKSVELRTVKLATFLKEEKIQSVDLMKIDVETHEPQVLLGMESRLEQMKPAMLIEILNPMVGESLEKILRGKGYHTFAIDETNGLTPSSSLTAGPWGNFLLCSREKAHELGLPA